MKISKAVNHGVECWVLNFKEDGKYRRRFFETKIAAEREMEALGLERRNFGTAFGAMTSAQRIEWGALDARLRVAGVTMTAVVDFFFQHKPAAVPVTMREALVAALEASAAGDTEAFTRDYRSVLTRFAKGRETGRVCDVKHEDVFRFVNNPDWRATTRNGYITRLQKFFSYCSKRGWLAIDPMKAVDDFKITDKSAAAILTVEQSRCLLHAAQRTNGKLGLMPYFALGLFCGLRPQFELRKMTWANVFIAEGFCAVDAATSKGERHRNVTLPPAAIAFLKLGGDLPAGSISFITRARKLVVAEANRIAKERKVPTIQWKQDVMRHTFASHHYNRPRATAEETKREMGHSRASQVLFDAYQARVRPADALAFWEITMENGRVFRAKMFMDATYEGDLLAKAGCSFHVGREANSVYGETLNGVRAHTPHHQFVVPVDPYVKPGDASSGLLPFIQLGDGGKPGDGDKATQAYNFRLCFTTNPKNRLPAQKPTAMPQAKWDVLLKSANNSLPVTPPANYDAKQFELLGRYFEALVAANRNPKLAQFWNPIWRPNHKTDINNNGGFSTDFIGSNYDYPNADYATRERIAKEHEAYIRGFCTFLATDPRVPEEMRKEMQSWGPSKDEFRDTDGWPRELYVREARRLVGEYVMSEKNCRYVETITDSVGLGAYNMDSHNCQRIVKNGKAENEGDVQIPPMKPYPVSYRSIIPKAAECENLFVPVCLSSSHIAYGSIRMEPVFMVLGQSAATAAAIASDDKVPVQKVNYEKLRARLLADKQVLDWTGPDRVAGPVGKFIDPKSLPGVVLDDKDAKLTGVWADSISSVWCVGHGYAHDGNSGKGEAVAVFTPSIPAAGDYEIILFNAPNPNRASNVPVTVSIPGQPPKTLKMDQKSKGEISLGKFKLPAGKTTTVTISNKETDGYVILDGAQFKPVK